jgi:antitoxin component YwqK of YwqJK toxin-antitoxin module
LYAQILTDTTINKIHYSWVKYDLNKNPYEIGQDYTNGVKNGRWIYRDQQGRITSIVFYKNDTLLGNTEEYSYLNDPVVVKYSGVTLNGYKVGKWVSEEKANRKNNFKKYKTLGYLHFDLTGRLIYRTRPHKNGNICFIAYYNLQGEECFWQFFDKKGKLIRETSEYPYINVEL